MHVRPMIAVLAGLAAMVPLSGCLSRKVSITSDPVGATVFMNDVEVGRTPLEAEFQYYGVYDVRVEKEGFEPLRTSARAAAPWYEYPPVDLVANAVSKTETVVKWHFTLEPALELRQTTEELERGVLDRAKVLRAKIEPAAE